VSIVLDHRECADAKAGLHLWLLLAISHEAILYHV
jgi:hypothetical protein